MADRGEALLDGRRRPLAAELLDVGGDMQRLHVGDRRDAGALAPDQKFPRGDRVGAARVPVADLSREEFQEARSRGDARRGDEGRDRRISPDDFEVAGHGSINSAINAASGASTLVKLAIVAASMAPGFKRSSPSGCPAFAASKVR